MNTEDSKPPPFYCPACGKKHRADLTALVGHQGAHAKVTCRRCSVEMMLFLGSDGLPKCEVRGDAIAGGETSTAFQPVAGGTMPKSNLLVLVASAVVAAVVGYLAASMGSGAPKDAGRAEARLGKLEAALEAARTEIATLRAQEAADPSKIAADVERMLQPKVESVGKTVQGIHATTGALEEVLKARMAKLDGAYAALNGRIEANYQKGRELEKRVKALEAP